MDNGVEVFQTLMMKLANLKEVPDRLFVLLRKNFPNRGKLGFNIREFEKPTFRPGKDSSKTPTKATTYVRHKVHKSRSRMNPKDRSAVNVI